MNKKIIAIAIAVLSTSGIATLAIANKIIAEEQVIIPPIPVDQYPEVLMSEGVAYDKGTGNTEQVVFIIMNYNDEENIYLIIGDTTYKMTEPTNFTTDLGSGTKVLKYKSEDGDILTVLTQRFENWGQVSVSGDFKDYLITFKPMYYYGYTKPIINPVEIEEIKSSKLSDTKVAPRETRTDIPDKTRSELQNIASTMGIDKNDIANTKPIYDWIG